MSRVIAIAACGLALAGCASGGMFPRAEPTPVSIQFQSEPAGAEAKTSAGLSCETPCALAMAPDKDFSVTFSLAGYQPQTIPVAANKPEGTEAVTEASLSPNPVAVKLSPAPKSPAKRAPARKPAASASAAKPAAAKPAAAPPAQPAAPAADIWPAVR